MRLQVDCYIVLATDSGVLPIQTISFKGEPKMSRNTKIVIGIAGSLLLLCACAGFIALGALGSLGMTVARNVSTSPVKVQELAGNIADFQLPANYSAEASFALGGYSFVSYAPGDGHSHIQMVQAPASVQVDQTTLEQYAQQANPNVRRDRYSQVRTVGQTQATIRGQTVTLVISEGTNRDGELYRTMTGVFQGKGGPTLLSVESPVSTWDQAEVDSFIASIR